MPNFLSFSLLPIPDTCNKCGDPIDPADKITSIFALTVIKFSP